MATNTVNEGGILRDARSRYQLRAESGAHGAFDAEVSRSGKTPRSEVTVRRGTAPAWAASLLSSGEDSVIRERRMYVDDRLVQLADTVLPASVAEAAPQVAQEDTGVGGIISRMADAGLTQTDVVEDVALIQASADQAAALGVSEGDSLLTITHVGSTADGQVVEVTRHIVGPGWTLRYGVPLS
ncbi:UTRA domain-containing protein [Streptacidiphilus sp. MAP5-52]|uniref:UTRA domain-containing protein n=1 Tax=Streptacidiphilus sp. MAP5-52 TaxID=3156267 RepID=UPI003511B51D